MNDGRELYLGLSEFLGAGQRGTLRVYFQGIFGGVFAIPTLPQPVRDPRLSTRTEGAQRRIMRLAVDE